MKVLVIENNKDYAGQLATKLKTEGFEPHNVETVKDAQKEFDKTVYNLIFINWNIEAEQTIKFIHEIKKTGRKSSVFVLSDTGRKEDEITALNGGADDYFRMPFENNKLHDGDFRVLRARMDARLRFGGTNVISIDDLVIDPDEEKIFYQGKEIELKGKPFEVLTHLAKHRDQIVSKEQLLDAIWEEPELVTPNVIEVAINQIRQKMDKPLGIGTIETVRRRGYRFCFPNCTGEG